MAVAVDNDAIWQGKPAQLLNVPAFVLAAVIAVGAVWARGPLAAAIVAAAEAARSRGVGVFGGGYQPPWEWRKQ